MIRVTSPSVTRLVMMTNGQEVIRWYHQLLSDHPVTTETGDTGATWIRKYWEDHFGGTNQRNNIDLNNVIFSGTALFSACEG